jgi:signal transduction histidine kinase
VKNCLIAFGTLIAGASMAHDNGPVSQWSVRHFDVRNGLPQSSVMDMASDSMGFLWITTEGGLVRFDGRNFNLIRLIPGQDQLTTRTRQLFVTPDQELYVDDANGDIFTVHGHNMVTRVKESGRRLSVYGNIPSLQVYLDFLEHRQEDWPNVGEHVPNVNMIAFNRETWVVRHREELRLYHSGALRRTMVVPSNDRPLFLLNGSIFGVDNEDRVVRLDTTTGRCVEQPFLLDGRPATWPKEGRYLFGNDDQESFVHIQQDLYRCWVDQHGNLRLDALGIQLPAQTLVNSVVRIKDTNIIAVGTSSKGLHLYRPVLLRTVKCDLLGLAENSFYSQADLGQAGILTIGSGRSGLIVGDSGCSPFTAVVDGMSYASLCKDAEGLIWFNQADRIMAYSPFTGSLVETGNLQAWHPTLWAEGDSIWVADLKRLGYIKDRRLHWTADLGGTRYLDRPFLVRRDQDGRLVYGSCTGLYRATDSGASRFEADTRFDGLCVRTIEVIGDLLLVGTYGSGIRIVLKDKVHELPVDRNGALNHVHSFVLDGAQNLWMSTNKGLVRTTLADITTYVNDTTQRPFYAVYGANAGMTNPEFNGGCEPAWLRLADGRLSFPTMDGLVQFRPEDMPDPFPSYPILIGRVFVNGVPWSINEYSIFPPNTMQVSIELGMAYWGEPENAKLEYRITGINDEWMPLKLDQDRLVIDRPPAGEHEVFIRAVGSAARGVEVEPFYWFEVETSFWWTWKGYALMVAGLLGFVTLVWQWYTMGLRRRNRWLEENVRSRTQELDRRNEQLTRALETRESLIGVISHDIITPLRFISRVARSTRQLSQGGAPPLELDRSLEDLTASADKLNVNASALMDWVKFNPDQITPRIQPVDLCTTVLEAIRLWEEMAEREAIQIVKKVPEYTIVPTDPHLMKVILHNLIGNAITHAGRGAVVRIGYKRTVDAWELMVSDTGTGIDSETLERLSAMLSAPDMGNTARFARGDGQGIGYAIVASMARILKARVRLESTMDGTTVTLSHPIDR